MWRPAMPTATRGRIVKLDLDRRSAPPGVIAVLTAEDIPGVNDCSPAKGDDPILADGRIDFHGQVVFAVVARDARPGPPRRPLRGHRGGAGTAGRHRRGCDRRRDRTSCRPISSCAAMLPPPSPEFAAAVRQNPSASAGRSISISKARSALARARRRTAGCWSIPRPSIRPRCSICVAKMLAVPDAAVVCECRRMGGGFGGKESQAAQWAALAALAARVTGRAGQDAGWTATTT